MKKKITKMEALELMNPVMEAACDRCVHPCEAESQDELEENCDSCEVEKALKNLIYQLCEIAAPDKDLEKKFIEFWKEYPRKKDRKKAFEKWMRIRPSDELFETIMHALREQKRLDRQWQRGIIPNASTWLHNERWNDEIETSKQPMGKRTGANAGYAQRPFDERDLDGAFLDLDSIVI